MNEKIEVFDIADELIIIPRATIDEFLKRDKPSDLISLYSFYYYTAKWQKTNQPKCCTGYTAKGLRWNREKVIKTKAVLKDIGLIDDHKDIDKNGRIKGWYIKVKYVFKKNTVDNIVHSTQKPEGGDDHPVEIGDTNTLSSVNINTLSSINNIYMYWIKLKIVLHKKLTDPMKNKIKLSLKSYSEEDIKKSMENYNKVLKDEACFFTYKWGIFDFLTRGLHKFVDEADPLNNFKIRNGLRHETKDDMLRRKHEEYGREETKETDLNGAIDSIIRK